MVSRRGQETSTDVLCSEEKLLSPTTTTERDVFCTYDLVKRGGPYDREDFCQEFLPSLDPSSTCNLLVV